MEEPREVQADEEHERVWERVAAIDVAKASGVVCTRLPDEDRPGRRKTHLWSVQAATKVVIELGDYLRARQVQVVTLESTSDYWRIWFVILEAAGLKVQLVSARSVKNAPGRAKTDKKDAVRLAKLTEKGLLQPSFVPPYEIRRLRELTRLRAELVHDKSRYWARLEKLLERALVKVSAVLSTLDTDTARAMIEALIAGQRDPKALADLAIGKARAKRAGPPREPWRPSYLGGCRVVTAQRKYPEELRERAVKMVAEIRERDGKGHGEIARVGRQLGVHPEALRSWLQQAEIDEGKRSGTTTDDKQRIAELEREVRELRRANEILKAASAYFARELDPRLPR